MEFAGEPFYKFMAYERAAETLENAPPAPELIAAGELQALPGIGKTIAARVAELIETGRIAYREELAARYPPTLMEVLGVPGIGMKTVQALFRDQGIASLADLEAALEAGALAGTARLGPKSLENIKRGILAYKGRRSRTPLGRALPLAREAIAYLEAGGAAAGLTYAGSVRRAEATVGDIDIVCTSREPADVIARFVRWDRAQAVLAEGVTKASIWLARRAADRPARAARGRLRKLASALYRFARAQHPAARARGAQRPAGQRERYPGRGDGRQPHLPDRRGGLRRARARIRAGGDAPGHRRDRGGGRRNLAAAGGFGRPARRLPHALHVERRRGHARGDDRRGQGSRVRLPLDLGPFRRGGARWV